MPKTIAITPSWYWPAGIPRISGIPPFSVYDLCLRRAVRDRPGETAIVSGSTRMGVTDLQAEVDRLAAGLAARAGTGAKAVMAGDPTLDNVVVLLSALAAGVHIRIAPPGAELAAVARDFGTGLVIDGPGAVEPVDGAGPPPRASTASLVQPAVTIDGKYDPVSHSHRSLLAGALGLVTFLDARAERPWLASLPLSRWEGLTSVLAPLYLGATLVLAPATRDADELVAPIAREGVGFAFTDLDQASEWTREAKRSVKDSRRILQAILLSTQGMFDSDERRRVSRSFECPALTVWGMPETGAVFASHQSWYLDESIGIPMTNVHVVPSEPRTGTPIAALWELVESAEVTLRSPSMMCGYEGAEHPERWVDHRFRTGMIASSDANGMIYLLGD